MARKGRSVARSPSRPVLPPVRPPGVSSVRALDARSTFRVANALRDLAADIPEVNYKEKTRKAVVRSRPEPQLSVVSPERQNVQPDGATTRDKAESLFNCKGRPRNSKGNGSARPFVPWCRK